MRPGHLAPAKNLINGTRTARRPTLPEGITPNLASTRVDRDRLRQPTTVVEFEYHCNDSNLVLPTAGLPMPCRITIRTQHPNRTTPSRSCCLLPCRITKRTQCAPHRA